MPRPKPPAPLKPRHIRLSDEQWLAFQHLGGSDWLRSRIDKLRMAGIAKRQRNNRIRRAYAMGESCNQIAERFGLDRTTVWRIVS